MLRHKVHKQGWKNNLIIRNCFYIWYLEKNTKSFKKRQQQKQKTRTTKKQSVTRGELNCKLTKNEYDQFKENV